MCIRDSIRGGGVDPSVDNFLKITPEARLLGKDARLIDKDAPYNPDGKLNMVAENVWKEYEKGNANGHIGCQLIFSDIGTPGPACYMVFYIQPSWMVYGMCGYQKAAWLLGKQGLCQAAVLCNIWFRDTDCF